MVDRYKTVLEAAHTERPIQDTPSTVLVVMLEAGHYYHVGSIPGPEKAARDLAALYSIILRATPLLAGPSCLLPDQDPILLSAIVSGLA